MLPDILKKTPKRTLTPLDMLLGITEDVDQGEVNQGRSAMDILGQQAQEFPWLPKQPMTSDRQTMGQPFIEERPSAYKFAYSKVQRGLPLTPLDEQALRSKEYFGKSLVPPEPLRKVIEPASRATMGFAESPTGQTISTAITVAALGYMGYQGVKSLIPLTKELGNKVLQTSLNKGLDKWIYKNTGNLAPEYRTKFWNWIVENKPKWVAHASDSYATRLSAERAARRGEVPDIKKVVDEVVDDTIQFMENILLPKGSQAFAMKQGGELFKPKTPKTGERFEFDLFRGETTAKVRAEKGAPQQGYGIASRGYWSSNKEVAASHAGEGGNLRTAKVILENPYVIPEEGNKEILDIIKRAEKVAEKAGKNEFEINKARQEAIPKFVQSKEHDGLVIITEEGIEVIPYEKANIIDLPAKVTPAPEVTKIAGLSGFSEEILTTYRNADAEKIINLKRVIASREAGVNELKRTATSKKELALLSSEEESLKTEMSQLSFAESRVSQYDAEIARRTTAIPKAEVTPPVTEGRLPKVLEEVSDDAVRGLIKRHYNKAGKPDGWQGTTDTIYKNFNEAVEGEKIIQEDKMQPVVETPKVPKPPEPPKVVAEEAGISKTSARVPKELKRASMVNFIQDKFASVRQGRVVGRKTVTGNYRIGANIIRVRKWTDISTIAHEVGHAIDDKTEFMLSRWIPEKEVSNLLVDYDMSGIDITSKLAKAEAFGSFLKYYVISPEKLSVISPTFREKFFKLMEQYPEDLVALNRIQDDYARWKKLPAVAKVASDMTFSTDKYPIDYAKNTREFFDKLYTDLVDDVYEIEKFSALGNKITEARTGEKVASREDISLLLRLMKGDIGRAQTFLEDGTYSMNRPTKKLENGKTVSRFTGKSLQEIFRKATIERKLLELSVYLEAKHVLSSPGEKELIATDKKDLVEAVKELEKAFPWMKETLKDVGKYTNALLDYGIEGEILDQLGKGRMQKDHPYYVPLFRDSRLLDYIVSGKLSSQAISKPGAPFKSLKGATLPVFDVLENLIKATYMVVSKANSNKIVSLMYKLSQQGGALAQAFEEIAPKDVKVGEITGKQVGKRLDIKIPEEKLDDIISIFMPETFLENGVIKGYIKGKPKQFKVSQPLFDALKGLNREQVSMLVRILGTPTRLLRVGAIYNPEFLFARNPIKDTIDATILSLSGFRPVVDTIKGAIGVVRKDADWVMARQMGAMRSTLASVDQAHLHQTLEDITEGTLRMKVAKHPIEALRMAGDLLEQASRLGQFKRVLAKTEDPWKAGANYREVTVDFLRMGAKFRQANALIAFANPAVQGTDRFFRAFKNHPVETLIGSLVMITLPTIGLYLLNRDDARWKEIPTWRKNTSWIIMPTHMPQEQWDKMSMVEREAYSEEHPIWAIPKPFLFGAVFGDVPERCFEVIDGAEPKIFDDLREYLVQAALPGYMPVPLEPIIENTANFDFFRDRKIINESRLTSDPDLQYTPHTTETAKILGSWINYPPWKIDNIIESWTAGLGAYGTEIIDTLLTKSGIVKRPPEVAETWKEAPILKALVLRNPYGSSGQALTSYYDLYNEYKAHETTLKQLLKEGDKNKFNKLWSAHPELQMANDPKNDNLLYSKIRRAMDRVNRQLSAIRDVEEEVYHNPDLTPQEKRRLIGEGDQGLSEIAWGAIHLLKEHPDEFVDIKEIPVKWR